MTDALDDAPRPFDPEAPLTASGNLRWRGVVNVLAEAGATAAALLAVAVLGILVFAVVKRGGGAITVDFLTKSPPLFGGPGGGIAPAIVGTAIIVLLATAIATPVGILVAIYVTEFARPRTARPIRLALDMLNGLPSIVIGLFVFGLLVAGHGQSGFAGSFALAIIMIPLIARATQEMLLLVPPQLREAADALGVSRWRSVLGIVVPSALGGIVTGVVLAIARAAGETAPLIFATSIFNTSMNTNPFGHALANIPVSIFTLSEQADPSGYERAWGAALVLLVFILATNVLARAVLARSQSKVSA
ncbi:phosphate ABC transporter permease PstA [Baekduia soli]|uniref:Phosphate transport system permease protein PstA n=1 Tax=Baekduia soli TaxID=496014 RepID=A0A5B8U476_9ACTN|nr:phosphate ABC transporter permease PstA [Baekduia soli]QEC47830.1 phosphate ABC transporter permease PstA [Baekduia soli]